MSYQWLKNSTNISGATSSSYTISSAQMTNAGVYSVSIVNAGGTVTSSNVSLTVLAQPTNQTVIQGQNVLLSVTASGAAPFTFQWQATNTTGGGYTNLVNGGQISGANTNVLDIGYVTASNALSYQVIISNAYGMITSSPAVLKVIPPVLVDVQFLGTAGTTWTYGPGSAQTGAAVLGASGDVWNQEPMTYYIYPGTSTNVNAVALVNSSNLASGLTLTVGSSPNSVFGGCQTNISAMDPATSNLMSSAIEQFALTANVDVWTFTVGGLSGFAGDQFNLVVYAGSPNARTQTISMTGGASGGNTGSNLTTSSTDRKLSNGPGDAYQIFTNGTLNGNNLVFTVNGGTVAVDNYSAFVNGFQLQIFGCPVITTQPVSLTNLAGTTAQFSVVATGIPLSCQWKFNGTNLPGATGSTLTLTNVGANHAGSYAVVLNNQYGSVTSAVASLTVNIPATVTTQPQSVVVARGQSVAFSVVPGGTAPFNYQWYLNGSILGSGSTSANLALNDIHPTNAGSYTVVVANNYGSVTSAVATLTVTNPLINLSSFPLNGAVAAGNPFSFQMSIPVGVSYVIEASTDLQNWTPIATNVATSASEAFTDALSTNLSKRFYRAMVQ